MRDSPDLRRQQLEGLTVAITARLGYFEQSSRTQLTPRARCLTNCSAGERAFTAALMNNRKIPQRCVQTANILSAVVQKQTSDAVEYGAVGVATLEMNNSEVVIGRGCLRGARGFERLKAVGEQVLSLIPTTVEACLDRLAIQVESFPGGRALLTSKVSPHPQRVHLTSPSDGELSIRLTVAFPKYGIFYHLHKPLLAPKHTPSGPALDRSTRRTQNLRCE